MKVIYFPRLLFMIIAICCNLSCAAQRVALSDTVSVNLPKNAEKLSPEKFNAYINTKFNQSESARSSLLSAGDRTDNKHFYRIGDILVCLIRGKRILKGKENYLSEIKKWFDATNHGIASYNKYTSEIKTINNNHVLITYYENENIGNYRFFCNDSNNMLALNGSIQFNIVEKDKAKAILDEIVKSIKFKIKTSE